MARFRESQFRAALDCSLRLMEIEGGLKAESIERATRHGGISFRRLRWRKTRHGARRSTACAPRRRGEDIGSWYARCPIRPIVFEDPGVTFLGDPTFNGDHESRVEPVHMHLEHRISQRLLGRFLSQGFVYHDLSRACLTQTRGSLPLVYLIGRLCLYGYHATRLHEDVIAVCAEWFSPDARKGSLRPVDRKQIGEEEYMRRLDDALLSGDTSRITDAKRQELLASAGQDISELQPISRRRRDELETTIRHELTRAGEKEAESTRKLLEDQDSALTRPSLTASARKRPREPRPWSARPGRDRCSSTRRAKPGRSTTNALVANELPKNGPC